MTIKFQLNRQLKCLLEPERKKKRNKKARLLGLTHRGLKFSLNHLNKQVHRCSFHFMDKAANMSNHALAVRYSRDSNVQRKPSNGTKLFGTNKTHSLMIYVKTFEFVSFSSVSDAHNLLKFIAINVSVGPKSSRNFSTNFYETIVTFVWTFESVAICEKRFMMLISIISAVGSLISHSDESPVIVSI